MRKEVLRTAGSWASKILLVICLVGFVSAIALSNLTSESFLKPVIGQIASSKMGNISAGGQEVISNLILSQFYEKKVCSGYSCIQMLNLKNPLNLLTADFHNFLNNLLWILGGLALLFGVLVALLAKDLPGKLTSLGGSLVIAGLPFFLMILLAGNLGSIVPQSASGAVPSIAALLNSTANVFLMILILGAVLLGRAMTLKRKK